MGYGTVSRVFHWATVVIVLIMIPVGLTMIQDVPRPVQNKLFILHKGLGTVFLVLILARVAWRLLNPPPPMPDTLPLAQRRIASTVHGLLYVLLVTMPLSGYIRVTAGGFPIELLNRLGIPPLLPKNPTVAAVAETVHVSAAWGLIALIVLHVGAALYHARRRDGIAARMWPLVARRDRV